jgi:hypothetical protein
MEQSGDYAAFFMRVPSMIDSLKVKSFSQPDRGEVIAKRKGCAVVFQR